MKNIPKFEQLHWSYDDGIDALELYVNIKTLPSQIKKYPLATKVKLASYKINEGMVDVAEYDPDDEKFIEEELHIKPHKSTRKSKFRNADLRARRLGRLAEYADDDITTYVDKHGITKGCKIHNTGYRHYSKGAKLYNRRHVRQSLHQYDGYDGFQQWFKHCSSYLSYKYFMRYGHYAVASMVLHDAKSAYNSMEHDDYYCNSASSGDVFIDGYWDNDLQCFIPDDRETLPNEKIINY